MSVDILQQAHNEFYHKSKFIYQSDYDKLKKFEDWRVLKCVDGVYTGDCEDAALTIMNLCIKYGIDKEDLFIVRCATKECPEKVPFNHAILGLKMDYKWYFSDNLTPDFYTSYTYHKLYDAVSVDNLKGTGKPKLFSA